MGLLDALLGEGINRIAGGLGSWWASYRETRNRARELPRYTSFPRPAPLPASSGPANPRELWQGVSEFDATRLPQSKAKTDQQLEDAERKRDRARWDEVLQQFERDFLDAVAPGGTRSPGRARVPPAQSRAAKQRMASRLESRSKQSGFVDTTGKYLGGTQAQQQIKALVAAPPGKVKAPPRAGAAAAPASRASQPRPRVPDIDFTNQEAIRDAYIQEAAASLPAKQAQALIAAIPGVEPQLEQLGSRAQSGQSSAARSSSGQRTNTSPAAGIPGTRGKVPGRAGARSPALSLDLSTAIGIGLGAALSREPLRSLGRSALASRTQIPIAQPLAAFSPQKTRTKVDDCECEKPKKRKPRQPRTVCKTGRYTQTSRGVRYSPTGEVPCQ